MSGNRLSGRPRKYPPGKFPTVADRERVNARDGSKSLVSQAYEDERVVR